MSQFGLSENHWMETDWDMHTHRRTHTSRWFYSTELVSPVALERHQLGCFDRGTSVHADVMCINLCEWISHCNINVINRDTARLHYFGVHTHMYYLCSISRNIFTYFCRHLEKPSTVTKSLVRKKKGWNEDDKETIEKWKMRGGRMETLNKYCHDGTMNFTNKYHNTLLPDCAWTRFNSVNSYMLKSLLREGIYIYCTMKVKKRMCVCSKMKRSRESFGSFHVFRRATLLEEPTCPVNQGR